jgi:DNA-binding Lrp family transcriptional regulator
MGAANLRGCGAKPLRAPRNDKERAMETKKRPVRAYVLINVRAGYSKTVARALTDLPGVLYAHACWGVPDVFGYIEVDSQRQLDDLVMERIQKMEGVERTDTHIALE